MKVSYKKSGALVMVNGESASLDIKVTKDEKALEMHISRQQKEQSEKYTRSMAGGAGEAIRGDILSQYSVEINIGGESKKFNAEFSGYHFDNWGDKASDYNVNLEQGIPANEYDKLCGELSKQNTAVAQVFKEYVLNAEDLQKCNNLQQSIFNQKLDEFLAK